MNDKGSLFYSIIFQDSFNTQTSLIWSLIAIVKKNIVKPIFSRKLGKAR